MITIRSINESEYEVAGRIAVDAYASLEGMPSVDEQPSYYERIRNVPSRKAEVIVAVDEEEQVLGCVDLIDDLAHYGAREINISEAQACGIRLLAVRKDQQGRGIGKALTEYCLARAQELNKSQIILHTTQAMMPAWRMYEKLGFIRRPELDFLQGDLQVFGFGKRIARGNFDH